LKFAVTTAGRYQPPEPTEKIAPIVSEWGALPLNYARMNCGAARPVEASFSSRLASIGFSAIPHRDKYRAAAARFPYQMLLVGGKSLC
jgi:hypothetical protein